MVRAAIVALVFAAGTTGLTAGDRDDFSKLLEARALTYEGAFTRELAEANVAIKAFVDGDDPALFETAMIEAHEASVARGRGMTLDGYVTFFRQSRSALQSDLWFQERVSEIEVERAALARLESDLKGVTEGTEVVRRTQAWIEAHGVLEGKVSEIELLFANASSYFAAKSAADQRKRERVRSFLANMGAALRDNANAPVPVYRAPVTVRCTEYYSGTQCTVQ